MVDLDPWNAIPDKFKMKVLLGNFLFKILHPSMTFLKFPDR
jgi:hypothetical protein